MQASNKVVPIPCVRRVFYEADENDDLQAQYRFVPVLASAIPCICAICLERQQRGLVPRVIWKLLYLSPVDLRGSTGLQELVRPA